MFKKIIIKKLEAIILNIFSQDYDLWCKLSNIGRIKNISKNLVLYGNIKNQFL